MTRKYYIIVYLAAFPPFSFVVWCIHDLKSFICVYDLKNHNVLMASLKYEIQNILVADWELNEIT